jgi:hypothetical protein
MKLTFTASKHGPLLAYGASHDYLIDFEDGKGRIGKYTELLNQRDQDKHRAEAYAAVPNATTNELIRLAEEWEKE